MATATQIAQSRTFNPYTNLNSPGVVFIYNPENSQAKSLIQGEVEMIGPSKVMKRHLTISWWYDYFEAWGRTSFFEKAQSLSWVQPKKDPMVLVGMIPTNLLDVAWLAWNRKKIAYAIFTPNHDVFWFNVFKIPVMTHPEAKTLWDVVVKNWYPDRRDQYDLGSTK